MKKSKILLLTLLSILLLGACGSKKGASNVSESISQAASEISKETTAEGKTITTLSNGTIIKTSNDGSTIEIASDGTTKEIQANGTIIETATDGTITETKIDGTVILAKTDGSKIETKPDGSTKEIQAATESPTVVPIEVAAQPPIQAPTPASTQASTQEPTQAQVPVETTAPTQAPTEAPTEAPVLYPYVLTSAETFLIQGAWSAIGSDTSQNVYDQLCIIGEDLANGKDTEAQAIDQIKNIKDSTQPEWWIYGSYAKIIAAPGKLDCSTTALKHEIIHQLDNNIGSNKGESKYLRVFYNPNTDTTIIYFVSVDGTTVHN